MITEAFLEAFWGITTKAVEILVPIIVIKIGFGILIDNIGIKK